MKKMVVLLALLLFSLSCTKNEAKLSDFVVGTWKSDNLDMGGTTVYFTAEIKTSTYVLSLTTPDGSYTYACPETGYTIIEKGDKIVIDQPQFPNNPPSTGTVTFIVSNWIPGGNKMTWTPDAGSDSGTPTINWTRK